jgi:uncharacterized protein (TIGR02996 family)
VAPRDRIEAARAMLAAGDVALALAELLTAWRACRAPLLAEAIERVGARAALAVHAPIGATDDERQAAWLAAAAIGDPVVRGRLVATLTDAPSPPDRIARAEALIAYQDPRVATGLFALLEEKQYRRFHEYWRPLFELLCRCGDPRARHAMDLPWTATAPRRHGRPAFDIAKVRERLAVAYPDPPPQLDAEDAATVAAICADAAPSARGAETEAALLAAVHANPAEDGPRAIYGDWLLERGDPRGELIALQLAGGDRKRAQDLVAQHRPRWIAGLEDFIFICAFARGFLDDVWFVSDRAIPSDPRWSTVTKACAALPASDDHPMPILAVATSLPCEAIIQLASLAAPPPLRTLGWSLPHGGWSPAVGYRADVARALEALATALPRLSHLEELQLSGTWAEWRGHPDRARLSWQGSAVRSLLVHARITDLRGWLGDFVEDRQLERFELRGGRSKVVVERTTGRRLVLAIDLEGQAYDVEERFGGVVDALDQLQEGQIASLTMSSIARSVWTLPRRRRMAAVLDRHPAIDPSSIAYFVRPTR